MPPRSAMLPAPMDEKAPLQSGPPLCRRAVLRFFLSFGLIYALLIVPWPGFKEGYGRYFRFLCETAFAENHSARYLQCEPSPDPRFCVGIQIALGNREQVDANGHLPVKILGLEARGVGWIPTALIVALTLATPIPWRRRVWALLWGWLLVHAFILFSVGCYIWNESTDLGLVVLNPFWKVVVNGLEETLISQLGASFVVPVVIWLLVTFRLRDLTTIGESALDKFASGNKQAERSHKPEASSTTSTTR